MNRRTVLKNLALAAPAAWLPGVVAGQNWSPLAPTDSTAAAGRFQPTWASLQQYQTPDWYRDANFGLWAHWGPQCQPERGDWYARGMYQEGSDQYKYHVQKYGHPSKFGLKDVINEWKAEEWNPDELLVLYKKAGAKYFVALANHHDNFDLYDSRHQPWNSTRLGPKKDLVGGWAKAAKKQGLRFGVSVHAAHTWSWLETAQRADKNGPLAGVPYDGSVTTANGQGGGRATTRRPSTPKTTRSVRTAKTTADYRAGSWQSAPAPIRTPRGVARVHRRPIGSRAHRAGLAGDAAHASPDGRTGLCLQNSFLILPITLATHPTV